MIEPIIYVNHEIALDRGIFIVLGLNGYNVGGGVGFVIKSGGGPKGAIGVQSKERIIIISIY